MIDLYWSGAPLPEIASEMREEEKEKLFLYFFTDVPIHGCINVQPVDNSFVKQNPAQIRLILVAEGGGVEMAGSTNLVVPIVLWGRSPVVGRVTDSCYSVLLQNPILSGGWVYVRPWCVLRGAPLW